MQSFTLRMRMVLSHPIMFLFSNGLILATSVALALFLCYLPDCFHTRLLLEVALRGNALDQTVIGFIAHSFSHPWLSWALGLVVGTPFAVLCKRMMRAHSDLFVRLRFQPMMAWYTGEAARFAVPYGFINLSPMVIAGLVCRLIPIAVLPALMSAYVPFTILYPEIRRIYDAALADLSAQQ